MIPHLWKLSRLLILVLRLIESGTTSSRQEGNRISLPAWLKQQRNGYVRTLTHSPAIRTRAGGFHIRAHVFILQPLDMIVWGCLFLGIKETFNLTPLKVLSTIRTFHC